MTPSTVAAQLQAALAFDSLAESYDDLFTRSTIGRIQRDAVWRVLANTFHPGQNILTLDRVLHRRRRGLSLAKRSLRHRMRRLAPDGGCSAHTSESRSPGRHRPH